MKLNKKSNYYLVGYSGHSFPIIEAFHSNGNSFEGYFEIREKKINPYSLKYLGNENLFQFKSSDLVFIGIGDNLVRKIISTQLQSLVSFFSIVDSTALVRIDISKNGIIVNAGAIIQPQCIIGDGVIINTRAVIEHECTIENYVHIAPGAVLTGNVFVGENTLIGANATVLPGIKIGKNCVIGAGSVVTKNVMDNSIMKGNPAK